MFRRQWPSLGFSLKNTYKIVLYNLRDGVLMKRSGHQFQNTSSTHKQHYWWPDLFVDTPSRKLYSTIF